MINREKVSQAAIKIQKALQMQSFTADESICLLKCLEKLLEVRCLEKGMRIVSDSSAKVVET